MGREKLRDVDRYTGPEDWQNKCEYRSICVISFISPPAHLYDSMSTEFSMFSNLASESITLIPLKICGKRMKHDETLTNWVSTLQVLTWCWIWMLPILSKRWCFCGRSCQDIAQINCGSYNRWGLKGIPCGHCATHWDLWCIFSIFFCVYSIFSFFWYCGSWEAVHITFSVARLVQCLVKTALFLGCCPSYFSSMVQLWFPEALGTNDFLYHLKGGFLSCLARDPVAAKVSHGFPQYTLCFLMS